MTGRFQIKWGDEDGNCIELGPFDFCSGPQGVVRCFNNISNKTGRLLAAIHVQSQDQADGIDEMLADWLATIEPLRALSEVDSRRIRWMGRST